MKMNNWVLPALLFGIVLQNNVVNADGSVNKNIHEGNGAIISQQDSSLDGTMNASISSNNCDFCN